MGFFKGLSLNNIGGTLFGKPGPSNPYSAVDFESLMKQDLEAPGNAYDYGGAYKNLLSMINAPSSVEAVQQDVEGQQMQNLLADVGIQTKNAYGSTMSDMADRGLVGAGQSSDIAANALGQVNAMGARTSSGIYGDYALARLQRLFGKEQAAQGAQENYANLLGSMAEDARTRNLNRMLGLSGQQTQAYGQAVGQQYQFPQPGIIESMSRKGADEFGKSFGSSMGSGAAMMACFHPDTEIALADGTAHKIGQVKLGDRIMGGKVLSIRRAYASDMCQIAGVLVTASHCVLDNGTWKRVGDCERVEKKQGNYEVVSLIVSGHRILAGGLIFDDELETTEGAQDHIEYLNKSAHVGVNHNG